MIQRLHEESGPCTKHMEVMQARLTALEPKD